MIHIQCPHCHTKLAVKETMAGRLGVCPKCKNKVRIPQLETITPDDLPEERISAAPNREAVAHPTRPPRRFEEDDEDDRPARPRRRAIADADDRADDDPAPRPRRKRRKRRRRETSGSFSFPDVSPVWFGLIGVIGIWVISLGLALVFPAALLVPFGLGCLLAFAGRIWFLVVAFQDDVLAGVLCLFVPFYELFYLITHFDETKGPFFTGLLGGVMIISGFCAGGLGGAIHGDRPPPGVHGAVCVPGRVVA